MSVHTIRLRNAWRACGGGVYERRFNRPTGLSETDVVWLAIDPQAAVAEPIFNDEPVNFCETGRVEIGRSLRPSNVLTLRVEDEATLATVRLEIESPPSARS